MSRTFAVFALLVAAMSPAIADPYASDWSRSAKSTARLISDGRGHAAIEIRLDPDSITYWRNPGDAGIAPLFDFSGSDNVTFASIRFPAPERIAEPDGSEAFGYHEGVILPIEYVRKDPSRPATLAIAFDYGVCEKLCFPGHADMKLELKDGGLSEHAASIASATALVPPTRLPAEAGVEVVAEDPKNWIACAPAGDGVHDLFLEPPRGYWLTSKASAPERGRDCFDIALEQSPKGAPALPLAVPATIVGGHDSYTTSLVLPAEEPAK